MNKQANNQTTATNRRLTREYRRSSLDTFLTDPAISGIHAHECHRDELPPLAVEHWEYLNQRSINDH